jgi:ribosomal protein S18 acetylase RimI-like enzyme
MIAAALTAPLQYRHAERSDISAIVALVESAYRGESSRAGWTTEADLLGGQRTNAKEVEGILSDPDARLLLAIRSAEVVGCVLLRREATSAYVGMLAVRPELQGSGIGRRLLAEVEGRAKTEFGLSTARMTVIEQRLELIAYYERRGYLKTTRTEPFPYGDPDFGLPKRDDLRFVVLEKSLT